MAKEFFFSILWISLILTGNVMTLKSGSFSKSLLAFVILAWWWSAGYKYLTKHHLKHLSSSSSSSIFSILIKPFLGSSKSIGNFA